MSQAFGQPCSDHFLCGLPVQTLANLQVTTFSLRKLNRSPTPGWVTLYFIQRETEKKKKKGQFQDPTLNKILIEVQHLDICVDIERRGLN